MTAETYLPYVASLTLLVVGVAAFVVNALAEGQRQKKLQPVRVRRNDVRR
ncbi:hypothetical protein [Methylopila sp. M107]|nr:hypothetical protein [Methylopila sp. M107]